MERLTTTPFGRRPVTCAQLAAADRARALPAGRSAPKWPLFRELCAARQAFGVTDRDLAVLDALLTFHRPDRLDQGDNLIVFASNRALCARAHGMAESTLRRHLAALVDAGLILRHDSPNGKRYAKRGEGGRIARAFGFDLAPLLVRADEILAAAHEAREAAEDLRRRREAVVLRLRDCSKLIQHLGADETLRAVEDGLSRQLRRKLDHRRMAELENAAEALLSSLTADAEAAPATADSGASDEQNERHIEISTDGQTESSRSSTKRRFSLELLNAACPDMAAYLGSPPRTWGEAVSAASRVAPMLGIGADVVHEAHRRMGAMEASIAIGCILQRVDRIRKPGAYLRTLSRQAGEGAFDPMPMVRSLLGSAAGVGAS